MTPDAESPHLDELRRAVLEVMADAVVGTDLAGRVTLWNAAAERLHGHSAEEAMGRPADELLRDADGRVGDLERTTTTVRDEAGEAVGSLLIHRDATDGHRVELGDRRLLAVIDASPDFIGVSDLEGRPLFLNAAGRRLAGLSDMDEVRGHHITEFFAPEQRAALRNELLPRVLAQGRQAWELDFYDFRTGERIPVWWDAFRIDDPDTGEPIALATVTRDLREPRGLRQELERHRRYVDTVFANITDAFYSLDRGLRFSYLNDRAVRALAALLGEDLGAEDFLGNEVFAMFPGMLGTDTERYYRMALAEGRSIAYEYLYPPRSRWFDIRVHPTDDGLAVYFVDITDRKDAEAMRGRQTRQQTAVAELGVRASRGGEAVSLMEEAVAVVARTLDVELVAVAELSEDGTRMLLRAGEGWDPGVVGVASSLAGRGSFVGYAAWTEEPIVCVDVRREDRCRASDLILSHGVTSAAAVPIMGGGRPFGAFGVFSRGERRFEADEVNFLRAVAHVLHTAIARAEMAKRLDDVRDAERRRLARELHDETLQDLGVALARAADPEAARGGVDHELVRGLIQVGEQIRAAIYNLRLGASHAGPFPQQVTELIDRHRPRLPAVEAFVAGAVPDHPPQGVAGEVLRVLGEALTNVGRHAAASHVQVDVDLEERTLVVRVQDDGRGLADPCPPDVAGGHGIPGMRERAEVLGGELRLERPHGGGTLVELRVPLARRRPAERTRVLLVDDHAAIREAIGLAFTQDDEFIVVGQAGTLAEARLLLDGVDLAVVDLELPDGHGADLIEQLRARDRRVQTMVLTAHVDRASVARAVERGAAAVLGKTTHLHEVVAAARRLRAGETLMPLEDVVEHLRFAARQRESELEERRLIESLSPRELEVLQLLAAGLDTAAIAARLFISPRTERNHVANILAKLGVPLAAAGGDLRPPARRRRGAAGARGGLSRAPSAARGCAGRGRRPPRAPGRGSPGPSPGRPRRSRSTRRATRARGSSRGPTAARSWSAGRPRRRAARTPPGARRTGRRTPTSPRRRASGASRRCRGAAPWRGARRRRPPRGGGRR